MKILGSVADCCVVGVCGTLVPIGAFANAAMLRVRAACGIIEAESNAFFTKSLRVGRLFGSDVAKVWLSELFIAVAPQITFRVLRRLRLCLPGLGTIRRWSAPF